MRVCPAQLTVLFSWGMREERLSQLAPMLSRMFSMLPPVHTDSARISL